MGVGGQPQDKGLVSVATEEGKVSAHTDFGEGRFESSRTVCVGRVRARTVCPLEEKGKSAEGTQRRRKTGRGRAGILKEGGQDMVWKE